MKKILLIIILLLLFIEARSQNIDLNNTTDYIRVQKTGETGYTRAFGLNGTNQLYIGSIEKTIGNMYFFNKGTDYLMTLNPSGNLGIGTTNPGAKLDILSNDGQTESLMRFKISDAPSDYLQIANSTGAGGQFIPLIKGYHATDNRYSMLIMGSTSDAMDNGSNALINFNARRSNSAVQTRPLFVWTNYDQRMMTMTANGNVGIGTTTPTQKLQIDALDSAIQIQLNRTGSNTGKADFGVDNTGLHYWIGGYDGFGKEEFFIGVNGNVGIGTTDTKGFKLGVKGKVAAEEVKVALYNAWPDYVFESNYQLPTLQEVENHITEKGHLENIPSAVEVAKNGILLGEMNAKLLQKIEELTLYMIEQNKKTEEQQLEISEILQENNQLKLRLEKLELKK